MVEMPWELTTDWSLVSNLLQLSSWEITSDGKKHISYTTE